MLIPTLWSSLVLSLPLVNGLNIPEVFKKDVCNADNCLRAVRATAPASRLAAASADCSSFFRTTVTPCAVTTTITQTSSSTAPPALKVDTTTLASTETDIITSTVSSTMTVITGIQLQPVKRVTSAITACPVSVTPSSVPTYASACSGAVRYSSACSCLGVTATATTLAPVVVTVFATETVITTSTSTSISTEVGLTTTSSTTTTSVVSKVTSGPIVYELEASNTDGGPRYQIDIVIQIDRNRPCGPGGFRITNICGSFSGFIVTYMSTDLIGGADNCLYTFDSGTFVSGNGLAFRFNNEMMNIYAGSNAFFDTNHNFNGNFGAGGYLARDLSNPRVGCLTTSPALG